MITALTAKSFKELNKILKEILNKEELERFIGEVVKMSKDTFSIHEWEKEKTEELLKYEEYLYGKNEGLKEGKNVGIKEKSIEIAKNMLNKKMDIKIISEMTGLSKEEIENLK